MNYQNPLLPALFSIDIEQETRLADHEERLAEFEDRLDHLSTERLWTINEDGEYP